MKGYLRRRKIIVPTYDIDDVYKQCQTLYICTTTYMVTLTTHKYTHQYEQQH